MPKFMLILNHTPGTYKGMSPEEMQRTVESYVAWVEKIRLDGRYVVSDKLQEEGGKVVAQAQGKVSVIDGPYTESKEVIGGYFTIRAASYGEAVEIASGCPFLGAGSIVVRQTDPAGCGDE